MEFDSSLILFNSNIPLLLEKRIKLLEAINEEGSISKAAKIVPMSYKSAWEAVDSINNLCSKVVVKKEIGGVGGGGATLTTYGKNLIKTYKSLQNEHEKFLKILTKKADFHTGNLKSLKRVAMEISARNQILTKIENITSDKVNSNITLKTKNNNTLISNISKNSVDNLELKLNEEVISIFKSNNVMISTSKLSGLSARNKLKAKIKKINFSEVNCEVLLEISNNEIITSIITKQAIEELELKLEQEVYAVIKSSDIMIGK